MRSWESEEMQAYAAFEALMEEELEASRGSAASSVLERNKNRVGELAG